MRKKQQELVALADRVRLLVDRYWKGSVNYAAKSLGVPQQTLHRIVTGKTPNPRISVVAKIAEGGRVSPDWLMSGTGPEPPDADDAGRKISAPVIRLRNVLDRIGATPMLRRSIQDLAASPFMVGVEISARSRHKKDPTMTQTIQAGLNSMDGVDGAWADVLEAAVREYGPTRVLAALSKEEPLVALGFTRFAFRLWLSPRQTQIAKVYGKLARESESPDEPTRRDNKRKANRRVEG